MVSALMFRRMVEYDFFHVFCVRLFLCLILSSSESSFLTVVSQSSKLLLIEVHSGALVSAAVAG